MALPCYLYAICAGDFICVENPVKFRIPMKLYYRTEVREHLERNEDYNEFFRIIMLGIDYLE